MSVTIPVDEWLLVLRQEYLRDFIKRGGAAVKFVVPLDGLEHKVILDKLRQAAEETGYLFASVDAAITKAHMIDKVFHTVAKQVAWDDLAYTFLRSTLSESQYRLPAERKDFDLEHLASLNGHGVGEMRVIINHRLQEQLFRDYAMTQEFRIAMQWLCRAQLEPKSVPAGIPEGIRDWLHGELRLISALKPALIFQKIGRHNGRDMLLSLSHWLHITGKAGLLMVLDISRFSETSRPKEPDGSLYYTTPAVKGGYEALRQFIDDTDDLHFCLLVVVAHPSFLIEGERRGLWGYDALKLRIWDEVHDRKRPNVLSSLVRLSGTQQSYNAPLTRGAQ